MAQRVVPVIRTDSPPPAPPPDPPPAFAEAAHCGGSGGAGGGDGMSRLSVPGSFVSYLDPADEPVFRGTNNSAGAAGHFSYFTRHDSYRPQEDQDRQDRQEGQEGRRPPPDLLHAQDDVRHAHLHEGRPPVVPAPGQDLLPVLHLRHHRRHPVLLEAPGEEGSRRHQLRPPVRRLGFWQQLRRLRTLGPVRRLGQARLDRARSPTGLRRPGARQLGAAAASTASALAEQHERAVRGWWCSTARSAAQPRQRRGG